MDTDQLTLSLTQIGKFTVSGSAAKWAIVRAPNADETRRLIGDSAIHDCVGSQGLSLIAGSPDDFFRLLSEVIESKATLTKRGKALAKMLELGLVVAPYGTQVTSRYRYRTEDLYPDFEEHAGRYASLIAPTELRRWGKRALAYLLLSTTEGRALEPSHRVVEDWIEAHLRPTSDPAGKWIDDINPNVITGLRELASAFSLSSPLRKYSRLDAASRLLESNADHQHWHLLFEEWLNEKHYGAIDKHRYAFKLLSAYWVEHRHLLDPNQMFARDAARTPLFDWAINRKGNLTAYQAGHLKTIDEFLRWYVGKQPQFAIIDDWTHELVLREGYVWPFRPSDLDEIAAASADQIKPASSVQMALPLEYLIELEKILLEDDMAWPKSRRGDWIQWSDPDTQKETRVFCPVLPYMILLLIKLPIRSVQARRLDSGEGDAERYNAELCKWEPNSGPHAGYWARHKVRNLQRGMLRRIEDTLTGTTMCGFFINSNKIKDRQYLFSDQSGYVISWQNPEVIEIVDKLRCWQEKYNPVSRPLPAAEVRKGVFPESADAVKARRPDAFYLFRYPGGNASEYPEHPPTAAQVRFYWYELLAELESRISKVVDPPPRLIDSWTGPSPQSSAYTIHGLRVGGLTRLAMAGAQPWILQNIVAGHAAWIMTIYYVKPSPRHISDHLTEKYVNVMEHRQEEFRQFLSSRTLDEVRRIAVTRGPDAIAGLAAVRQVQNSAALMSKLDHGICPNGCTRCDEGMSIHERTEKRPRELRAAFGPVPQTVGGVPDCSRCRFFVTGTPYIDGLRVKTNEISYAAAKCAERQHALISEIDKEEAARIALERSGTKVSSIDRQKTQRLRQELNAETEALCDLGASVASHADLFQRSRALLRRLEESGSTDIPALMYSESPEFAWGMLPRFQALDELCHSAKWFRSVRDADLQRERREKVLQMLIRQGRPPVLALLSESEANQAVNVITKILFSRLSPEAVVDVLQGGNTLESAGVAPEVDEVLRLLEPVTLPAISDGRHSTKLLPR